MGRPPNVPSPSVALLQKTEEAGPCSPKSLRAAPGVPIYGLGASWNGITYLIPIPHLPQDPRENSTLCNDMETSRSLSGMSWCSVCMLTLKSRASLTHLPPETSWGSQDIPGFRTCLRSTWLMLISPYVIISLLALLSFVFS